MRLLLGAALGLCLAVALIFNAGRSEPTIAPSAGAASRPNIVVVIADDQTLEDQVVMEKTNALLGSKGTTFQRFYAQHGLCCPSRATFLTGQYPHNHGVLYNKPPGGYTALDHSETLSVWLQRAGYYTAYIGKYLNGLGREAPWDERPPGWDNWQALIEAYLMYDWTMNDNGTLIEAGSAPADYQTDAIATRAEAVIRSREGDPQPFFLVVSPATPHKESRLKGPGKETIRPASRHAGTFADVPLPKPPSYNERDVSDKPRFIHKLPLITQEVEAEITKRFRDRREALLSLDDLVEKMVTTLEQTGQLENTVIIYWSDNGYEFGEHRIPDNKNEIFEESLRVPLIIRGGAFPAGGAAEQLVANIDLAPTIVALAGATSGRVMDGRDLLPLVGNPDLGVDRSLLINAYHGKNYANGIRTDTGLLWVEHSRGKPELYDLNNDPYELQSQHGNRAYDGVKSQLQDQLEVLKTCSGATCSMGK
jgi:N-acetylglucosamine-6-sulfatase